jgi:hypothetical protein
MWGISNLRSSSLGTLFAFASVGFPLVCGCKVTTLFSFYQIFLQISSKKFHLPPFSTPLSPSSRPLLLLYVVENIHNFCKNNNSWLSFKHSANYSVSSNFRIAVGSFGYRQRAPRRGATCAKLRLAKLRVAARFISILPR